MKNKIALALALAAASFAATAGELNYNYVEGGVARVDIDGVDDGDGFLVRGSAALGKDFYIFGGHGSVDANTFDADFSESQLGFGYHHTVSEGVDFIGEIGYIRSELDINGLTSGAADGGRVSVGFRGQPTDNLEAWLKTGYNRGGDFDGDFSATFGAQFKFNQTWGVVGEIETAEGINKYLVGVRASF